MVSGVSLSCRALLLGRLVALAASSAGAASTGETSGASGGVVDAAIAGSRSGQRRSLRRPAVSSAAPAATTAALPGGQPQRSAPQGVAQHDGTLAAATDAAGLPENRSASGPGAQCLWQGDDLGCGAVRDRDLCLRSVDGRPWRQWRGHLVYGQPCAWCDGENCLKGAPELCAPADWVRGRPLVTVASCSATAPFGTHDIGASDGDSRPGSPAARPHPRAGAPEGVGAAAAPGFACGAVGAAASSRVNNFYYTFTARSVDDCKRLCASKGYCRAMEYQAHDARCLLWWHPVESVEPMPGHTCALVHGAEFVELNSTEALASIAREAEALSLAKLNSTEAEALASDPSTTVDQDLFGELGSTSAEAEGGLEVLMVSDEPGTTTTSASTSEDQDGASTSGAVALAGWALCCAVVARVAPLLWQARRAPRRATRAAELQGLEDGLSPRDAARLLGGAWPSDGPGSALAAAAAAGPAAAEPLGAAAAGAPLPVLLGPAAAQPRGVPLKRAAGPAGAYAPLAWSRQTAVASPRWSAPGGPLPPTPRLTPRQPTPRQVAPATPPLTPRRVGPATPPLTPRQLVPTFGLPAATAPRPPHVQARPAWEPSTVQSRIA